MVLGIVYPTGEDYMERLDATMTNVGFHIEDFPNAVKVLALSGPRARALADVGLHRGDLQFAVDCLDEINALPERQVAREALWRSAVVHYAKCFGKNESRGTLRAGEIFKGDSDGLKIHEYFMDLRHKHLVHDENSYSQSLPGAILNKPGQACKIAKIVALSLTGNTLDQGNWANLKRLATLSLEHVEKRFDALCDVFTNELEMQPYDVLAARPAPVYTAPTADDVSKPRARP